MDKYYTIRGHRFTDKGKGVKAVATIQFYYLIFKALDGDEIARECVDAIMQGEGILIVKDADGKQVYPLL